MSTKQIVLNLGEHPAEMTADQFAEVKEVQKPYSPKLTFYTAQNADGKIVGSVLVNPEDRKAQAALVGGWIAAGYEIDKKPYKELQKILREEQSVIDEAAKAAKALVTTAAPTAPVAPATGESAAPAAAPAPAPAAAPAPAPGEKTGENDKQF